MCDVVLGTEADHLFVGKISSVIGDDSVGYPKVTYYVLPEELDNLLPTDLREWHCLDLFGEVVGGYQ